MYIFELPILFLIKSSLLSFSLLHRYIRTLWLYKFKIIKIKSWSYPYSYFRPQLSPSTQRQTKIKKVNQKNAKNKKRRKIFRVKKK